MINTISQWIPLLVIIVAWRFRHLWDKGLKALFCLYISAGIFEVINEILGGPSIMYHLWTPIEFLFLIYIISQWSSDLNYLAISITYGIVWIMIKLSGFESLQKAEIDTIALVFASLVFIIIPTHIDDVEPYQRFFMAVMQIYYGGCFVIFLTINVFEIKAPPWQIHSFFNIFAATGNAAVYFIRDSDIIFSNISSSSGRFNSIRKE